jgi:hypothetical protein
MGFFDFLTRLGDEALAGNKKVEPMLADLNSTRTVQELLRMPKAARDQAWSQPFLAHVADAAFFTRYPSVILGADRFPFFALHSTPGGQPYPAHVIHHMKDDILLEHGMGVVINPSGQDADWAFSYGDILNFHLNGVFYPLPPEPTPVAPDQGLAPQDRLPQCARNALRVFLQGLGVAAPTVMLASWDHAGPGSLELVFGFSPKEFTTLEDFRFAMNNLSWFLPRNYSYSVAGNQARYDSAFEPL